MKVLHLDTNHSTLLEQLYDAGFENHEDYTSSKTEIEKKVRDTRKAMEKAAKDLDFMMAASLRDKIKSLQGQLEKTKM